MTESSPSACDVEEEVVEEETSAASGIQTEEKEKAVAKEEGEGSKSEKKDIPPDSPVCAMLSDPLSLSEFDSLVLPDGSVRIPHDSSAPSLNDVRFIFALFLSRF